MKCCMCSNTFDIGYEMPNGEYVCATQECCYEYCKCEVKEETGFDVTIEKLIGIYSNPNHVIEYTNGEVRQQFSICFHCKIVSGNLTISSESHELKFFTQEEINNLQIHPSQKIRIEDYFSKQDKAYIR